jgi:hypothetical protein
MVALLIPSARRGRKAATVEQRPAQLDNVTASSANGENKRLLPLCGRDQSLIHTRKTIALHLTIAGIALCPVSSQAQWWAPRAPADFEECSEHAEKTAGSKEARATLIAQCEAKFAGRRKPGGGYSYYDFMQDRHFDIVGPNPTAEEQKQIDEQYTAYLDQRRRRIIAAAFSEKQKQQALEAERAAQTQIKAALPLPVPRPRLKASACHENSFSCGWSKFSADLGALKRSLLGPPPKKPGHRVAQSRN